MIGTDSDSINAFLDDINYLTCDYVEQMNFHAGTEGQAPANASGGEQDWAPRGTDNGNWFIFRPTHVDITHVILGGVIILLGAVMTFFACRVKKSEKVTTKDAFSTFMMDHTNFPKFQTGSYCKEHQDTDNSEMATITPHRNQYFLTENDYYGGGDDTNPQEGTHDSETASLPSQGNKYFLTENDYYCRDDINPL